MKSEDVLKLFNSDLEGEKKSKNLLLVLPAGKAAHIESGIAYGLGKKCYLLVNMMQQIHCIIYLKKYFQMRMN